VSHALRGISVSARKNKHSCFGLAAQKQNEAGRLDLTGAVRGGGLSQIFYSGVFAGVHLQEGGQLHRALIGRTFLRHYKMVYEGLTGTVTLESGTP
jgi:hypothetical protein